MDLKVLENTGTVIESSDGVAMNRVLTAKRDGIIRGRLNDLAITKSNDNLTLYVNSGHLFFKGVNIILEQDTSFSVSATSSAVRNYLVCTVTAASEQIEAQLQVVSSFEYGSLAFNANGVLTGTATMLLATLDIDSVGIHYLTINVKYIEEEEILASLIRGIKNGIGLRFNEANNEGDCSLDLIYGDGLRISMDDAEHSIVIMNAQNELIELSGGDFGFKVWQNNTWETVIAIDPSDKNVNINGVEINKDGDLTIPADGRINVGAFEIRYDIISASESFTIERESSYIWMDADEIELHAAWQGQYFQFTVAEDYITIRTDAYQSGGQDLVEITSNDIKFRGESIIPKRLYQHIIRLRDSSGDRVASLQIYTNQTYGAAMDLTDLASYLNNKGKTSWTNCFPSSGWDTNMDEFIFGVYYESNTGNVAGYSSSGGTAYFTQIEDEWDRIL